MAGTQTKPAAKPAPKPPPEIKEVIAPSLQSARIRCDVAECKHAPPGAAPSSDQAPTGWFRGLFVLLAKNPPKPPPPKEGETPAVPPKPVFTLWATDGDGYLSPIATESDAPPPGQPGSAPPAPAQPPAGEAPAEPPPPPPELPSAPGAIAGKEDSVKLVPEEEYLVYLVLHPDKAVAEDFLKQANGDGIKDAAKFLKKLKLERERTGETAVNKKTNTKTIVEEPVFKVPDAVFLTEPGGDLYDGFCLFGAQFQRKFFATDSKKNEFSTVLPFVAMPNNYCPYVKNLVARLQAHLGALRFPVGTNGNPYFSLQQGALTVSLTGPDKKPSEYKIVFENPGVFDALTYNAVLSLQRHAAAGDYVKLEGGRALYDEMFEGEKFEPKTGKGGLPLVADTGTARRFSIRFLELDPATNAPWAAAPVGSPEFSGTDDGICGPDTATEIRRWLESGFRKSGNILRSIFPEGKFPDGRAVKKDGVGEWMRDDAVPLYIEWLNAVHSMNAPQDVLGTHTFRDIRDMVTGTAKGKIRNSIHKTGLAVDTAPVNGYMNQHADYAPIVTIDPVTLTGRSGPYKKIRWRLYENVATGFNEAVHGKARDDFARAKGIAPSTLFRSQVAPWQFDSADPDGGQSLHLISGLFLDITATGEAAGWIRISAASGMGAAPASIFKLEATKKKTIGQVIGEAVAAIEKARAQNPRLDILVDRPGEAMSARAGSVDTELLKRWMFAMQLDGFDAAPEVLLNPPLGSPVDRDKLEDLIHSQFGSDPMLLAFKSAGGQITQVAGFGSGSGVLLSDPQIAFVTPLLGVLWLQSGDTVTTSTVGTPRTREWWHFQHNKLVGDDSADSTSWFLCLEKIGWTKEGLRALGYAEVDITPPPPPPPPPPKPKKK